LISIVADAALTCSELRQASWIRGINEADAKGGRAAGIFRKEDGSTLGLRLEQDLSPARRVSHRRRIQEREQERLSFMEAKGFLTEAIMERGREKSQSLHPDGEKEIFKTSWGKWKGEGGGGGGLLQEPPAREFETGGIAT